MAGPRKILFVGDVMLGRLMNEWLAGQPPEYPWGDTLPLFHEADWRMCNLECVFSSRGERWPNKVFHFRSDPKNVAVLKAAGINAVSLANNHTLDFGCDALCETLQLLRQSGILYSGAGMNDVEACAPAIAEMDRTKIGLIAFTDNEPDWQATKDASGVFHVPTELDDKRAQTLLDVIRHTREQVDFLIVSAHWGGNWGRTPPLEHRQFGQAIIDAGADVLFGHSAHVFRGIEVFRGRPILHSTGDFVDDYAVDPVERNDQSFIFVLELENMLPQRMRLYPTVITKFHAQKAPEEIATRMMNQMKILCAGLGTQTAEPSNQVLTIELAQ